MLRGIEMRKGRPIVGFTYIVTHRRGGKILSVEAVENLVPIQGLNHFLSVTVGNGAQVATWYVGIFSGNYTPVITDTMSTFVGLSTEFLGYTETTRVEWKESVPASGSSTNAALPAVFTINSPTTIFGAFLSSNSAKGATAGTLLSATKFADPKAGLISGDTIDVVIPINMIST